MSPVGEFFFFFLRRLLGLDFVTDCVMLGIGVVTGALVSELSAVETKSEVHKENGRCLFK